MIELEKVEPEAEKVSDTGEIIKLLKKISKQQEEIIKLIKKKGG